MGKRSAAFERFMASTEIDYVKWHDGEPYDLDALRALDGEDRQYAEAWLLQRSHQDWRDLEGLVALGTPQALAAVAEQLRNGVLEQRLAAARLLPLDPAIEADREAAIVAGLREATVMHGMTTAFDLAETYRDAPVVMDELFRAALRDDGAVAMHAAALLAYLHGNAKEDFDWERRPFYVRFADADRSVREAAFRELCAECGVDPEPYLGDAEPVAIAGAATVATLVAPRTTARAARGIAHAVRGWLDSLDDAQRAQAAFPFGTDERFFWAYTPGPPRRGLPLRDMRPDQRTATKAIVAESMSARTAGEIAAVIALETVLGELEHAAGDSGWRRRDPELYWFAVFGEPSSRAPWSWRVGGHHVAIHVTIADGEVIGTTPSFLGANPAVIPGGPRAGERTLPGEEGLARALLLGLSPAERVVAVVGGVAPADILTGTGRHADVRSVPIGVRHGDLGEQQRVLLEVLIRHYVERARPEVAEATWARITADGLGDVTFAWAGSDVPGRGHYYAVRGPTFVIEYDNTQNGANHIHAVWRELGNDWGEDLLASHLAAAHAPDGAATTG